MKTSIARKQDGFAAPVFHVVGYGGVDLMDAAGFLEWMQGQDWPQERGARNPRVLLPGDSQEWRDVTFRTGNTTVKGGVLVVAYIDDHVLHGIDGTILSIVYSGANR